METHGIRVGRPSRACLSSIFFFLPPSALQNERLWALGLPWGERSKPGAMDENPNMLILISTGGGVGRMREKRGGKLGMREGGREQERKGGVSEAGREASPVTC